MLRNGLFMACCLFGLWTKEAAKTSLKIGGKRALPRARIGRAIPSRVLFAQVPSKLLFLRLIGLPGFLFIGETFSPAGQCFLE